MEARATLKGKDEKGAWKAAQAKGAWKPAQAKEYPVRLSLAIANAMIAAALRPPVTHKEPDMHSSLGTMQPYAPKRTEQEHECGTDFVDSIAQCVSPQGKMEFTHRNAMSGSSKVRVLV